jgi:hypothetical protein
MWTPMAILASVCALFGVFAHPLPVRRFIVPALGMEVEMLGQWRPIGATLLLLVAGLAGVAIYALGTATKTRTVEPFVGGEPLAEHGNMRMSGTATYGTLHDLGGLAQVYRAAEGKVFDVHQVGTKTTLFFSSLLGKLHNGVLPRYLAWCLLAMIVLFWLLLKAAAR